MQPVPPRDRPPASAACNALNELGAHQTPAAKRSRIRSTGAPARFSAQVTAEQAAVDDGTRQLLDDAGRGLNLRGLVRSRRYDVLKRRLLRQALKRRGESKEPMVD